MAGKIRYFLERNGHYWTRIAVPKALQPIIGKGNLFEALGDSREAALRKHPAAIARLSATLDAARSQAGSGRRRPLPMLSGRRLTPREMALEHYIDQTRFDDELRDTDQRYASGFIDEDYVGALRRATTGAASNDELQATVGWIIRKFRNRGADAAPASPEWRSLARALAGVELETLKRTAERDEGDFTGLPAHPLLSREEPKLEAAPDDKLGARIISEGSTQTLSELLGGFLAERGASPAMQSEHHVSLRMFEEFLGEPIAVYKITRAHLNGYKNALMMVPANYVKRFPGMTLPKAIEANQKRASPIPTLQPRTVNDKWLSRLHALLNWCVQNDVIPDNPASGVKVRYKEDSGKPPRSDFSTAELIKIFAAPMFDPSKPFGEDQWAMLISIFAGTRPSELAQIELDSIRCVRGVLVFAIEGETKNRGSQRMIPVHRSLIDLGLELRVAELRKAGKRHLFPPLVRSGGRKHASLPKRGPSGIASGRGSAAPSW